MTLGFVLPAASLGLGAVMFRVRRGFYPASGGPIVAQATVEEVHHDELEITQFPVEQNVTFSDHAIRRPAEVVIRCAWSNSPSGTGGLVNNLVGSARGVAATLGGPVVGNILAAGQTISGAQSLLSGNAQGQIKAIYEQLRALQQSRQPFDILTGKRAYKNMLFAALEVKTDPQSENALWVVAVCREVIIAQTQTVMVPISADPQAQADPAKTQAIANRGTVQLQPAATFTPDPVSFGSSISGLQGGIGEIQGIFGTLPASELAGVASSAINTLPSALEPAQAALAQVAAAMPAPSEIPLIARPQEFTISVTGALSDAQSAITQAVKALPAVLEQVQPAISEAMKQLPGVLDRLPSAFEGLPSALEGVQGQIVDVLRKVPEALARAPLSAPR